MKECIEQCSLVLKVSKGLGRAYLTVGNLKGVKLVGQTSCGLEDEVGECEGLFKPLGTFTQYNLVVTTSQTPPTRLGKAT